MIIKSIALKNYRNYKQLNLAFDTGINILYGDNAQGKTNLLEAIYLSATSKSHRTSLDKELILFSEEEAHVRLIIEKNKIEHKIDLHLKKNKKKGVAINGMPIHRSSELFGLVHVVLFSPEDLSLIKEGPKQRRRFIDLELCQLNPIYYHQLQHYHKVLKQRNYLLKQMNTKSRDWKETLQVWDEQLVDYGCQVIKERQVFIEQLNEILLSIHNNLTNHKEKLELHYENQVDRHTFMDKLRASYEKDLRNKSTYYGPHRDDIMFNINGVDIRKYGSQGQQRTAALSLKLGEIELVKTLIHDDPVLLLDDVLSELDAHRQKDLLAHMSTIQTFITCTGLEDFISHELKINRRYKVNNGQIFQ